MKLKALIIESTRYYRSILEKIVSDIGMECDIYATGEEALQSDTKPEYAFIIVSRYLDDTGAELFLHHYREKYLLGDALTIMITGDKVSDVMLDANNAGFKLVFNKKDTDSIQTFLISVLNNRTLNLKSRILYIEDQMSVAGVTVSLFESYQANIDHVTNLLDATEKFNSENYDLVITDYHLNNEETGDDIINLVRDIGDVEKERIPILVVSGEADQKKRTSFLRNGANDFIIKPYDDDELIVRSSNLIKNKKIFEQSQKQQKELTRIAMIDQLTGLYNRHSLFELGPKYLSDARRHKFPVSILVIDLDHFKKVNDTYGHSVGDVVLNAIGQVLKNKCRTEDLVARFGGEEFVMLLSHCGIGMSLTIGEKIRLAVEASKPNDLTITTSIGIASYNGSDSFDNFFDKADKAVYQAKDSGRNKVVCYSD